MLSLGAFQRAFAFRHLGSALTLTSRPSLPALFSTASGSEVPGSSGEKVSQAAQNLADAAAESATHPEDLGMDPGLPRVVVFGGSGYVGSRVCEHGVKMGLTVTSVSRHGRPAHLSASWANDVEWVKGDALDPQQPWRDLMKGSMGIISTLGAFGNNDLMYKVCGTANMKLMDAAAEAGVPRFAFVSVHDYKFPAGWHMADFLLRGYFKGKRDAEAHLAATFPTGGVAVRPGFIYGSRAVGSANIPLGAVGAPLELLLKALPTRQLSSIPIAGAVFVPPVSVDSVANALLDSVIDPAVPPGVMDVWAIAKHGGRSRS